MTKPPYYVVRVVGQDTSPRYARYDSHGWRLDDEIFAHRFHAKLEAESVADRFVGDGAVVDIIRRRSQ